MSLSPIDRLQAERTRLKIQHGLLPHTSDMAWVGSGPPGTCSGCDGRITPEASRETVVLNATVTLYFHIVCFAVWSASA